LGKTYAKKAYDDSINKNIKKIKKIKTGFLSEENGNYIFI
jgi:hypothetical protein